MRLGLLVASVVVVVLAWAGVAESTVRADEESPSGATSHPEAAKHEPAPASKAHDPDPIDHVLDKQEIEFFESMGITIDLRKIEIPVFGLGTIKLTKYMVLEVLAAILVALIYIPLARRLQSGEPARGGWSNAFESLLTFIRNEVARPNLGEHDADRHVPFLWTIFLFVLFCNLLGMFPFLGSPTASIYTTGALALCSFVAVQGAAIAKLGVGHYLESLWPHLDIPIPVMGFLIKLLICVIEIFGTVVKSIVLAVRLFANMFAGHAVLAMIMLFIAMAINSGPLLWGSITVASVLGQVALSLLELFVAFLQAYIFVFLTALFMGMALHPQH
jgi:F-type H+-transporting ATPase subunit a